MSVTIGGASARAERAGSEFRCGDLHIDVGRQRVLQAGQQLALPKLSFDLLLALVRWAPNVLSIDTLIERVWGGVVVSPETVIQRVKLLRDALGDNSQEPRYIGSLRARGYYFIPPVVDEMVAIPALTGASPGVPGAEDAAVSVPDARRRPGWHWAVALVTVAALAIFAAVRFGPGRHVTSLPPAPVVSEASFTHAASSTVAVMPFRNLSRDAADGFLATGFPEMILNQLAGVRNLAVVASSSSFALAPSVGDAREIGRRLNAGYLVEGTVQREGEQVRVTAQLIDTASGTLVWSESFDRQVHALFAMQDDISTRITSVLAGRVAGLAVSHEPQERSASLPAQLNYLHGLALLGRYTVAESEAAIPLFEKAIAEDPDFATAYAALYDAHMQLAERRQQDLSSANARWRPLVEKSLAINPRSGAAHFARAMWGDGTPRQSEADFRLGLQFDPSNGRGIVAYSEFLDSQPGREAEAALMLQRALWIDPLSARGRFRRVMNNKEQLGVAGVEQQLVEVLKLDPNYHPALQRYAKYRWYFHGSLFEAVQIIEQAIAVDPQNPWSRFTAMAMYLDLGDETAARDVASGTRISEQSSQVLLALFRGDWRRAGAQAYLPPASKFGVFESWGTAEAVRDYALRTGEIERAVQFLASQYELDAKGKFLIDLGNFRQAAIFADLLAAQSHTGEATRVRAAVAAWNDTHQAHYGQVFAKRLRARLWLLSGQRDAALQELADSFRAGDYVQWWYTLNYDPAWVPLHEDPRFRSIRAQVREYVEKQRATVDELRGRGEIPRRDGSSPALLPAAPATDPDSTQ